DGRGLLDACGKLSAELDRVERERIETFRYRRYFEGYAWFGAAAFVLWFGVVGLELTLWRRLPLCRQGDWGRQGDREARRQGEHSPCLPGWQPLFSPCLLVSPSPFAKGTTMTTVLRWLAHPQALALLLALPALGNLALLAWLARRRGWRLLGSVPALAALAS